MNVADINSIVATAETAALLGVRGIAQGLSPAKLPPEFKALKVYVSETLVVLRQEQNDL